MQKLPKAVLEGITGTSMMTLFSYLASIAAKENFREPEHLATLIHRLLPQTRKLSKAQGWTAHYLVGVVFAAVYTELWERRKIKPSALNALMLGAISGGVAVAIWKLTFKMHPSPPWIKYNKYYAQLVPAHIVFAIFATLTYKQLKAQE